MHISASGTEITNLAVKKDIVSVKRMLVTIYLDYIVEQQVGIHMNIRDIHCILHKVLSIDAYQILAINKKHANFMNKVHFKLYLVLNSFVKKQNYTIWDLVNLEIMIIPTNVTFYEVFLHHIIFEKIFCLRL